ncbi:MAG: TrmJ/YjtD family RNA methyltransferase [Thermoplasmata archaeon]|nr:TrmJ/YjtD family RNA methyltransferase [Thermoplasmata archaeon]
MTATLDVVLVRPKEDGNVGAVARVARNFGADRLVLVAPKATLGPEALRRAMGGRKLLESAVLAGTLEDAIDRADLVVGTTDLSTGRSTAYLRRSVSPERLGEMILRMEGRVALVFGPEDNGLGKSQLHRCDLLVHIPSRREFPTLNLSHAVGIVLYALHRAKGPDASETTPAPEPLRLNGREKEIFLERVGDLLARTGYPKHKRRGMVLLFRRVMGRSAPTESEYRMMLGFFRAINRSLSRSGHGG